MQSEGLTPQDALRIEDAAAIERQIPALRRYARSLVRDRERADDLVQDCLERAITRFDQFQPGTNLRTWLFTILHNLHCDGVRRRARRGVHVPIDDWMETAKTAPDQTRALHLRDFRRAFRSLQPGDQQILLLIGLDGCSYEEASAALNVAVGTVKSRLFRARARLRSQETELNTPRPAAGPGHRPPQPAAD